LKHIRAALVFLAVTFVLVGAGPSSAQSFPGRINGVVKDTQGAAVPDATVKLSNPSTGIERTVTTDANGESISPIWRWAAIN
jgi:hypothetical protein